MAAPLIDKIKTIIELSKDPALLRVLLSLKHSHYLVDVGWINSFKSKSPVDKNNNPIPWLTYPFIDFLSPRLKNEMIIFEFGSGNSTLFYAEKVSRVFTVEHNLGWYEKLKKIIPDSVQLHHKVLIQNGEYSHFAADSRIKFDIIIVDGEDRNNCIINSLSALKEDGVMILDDSERIEYKGAVDFLRLQPFKQIDFWGIGATVFLKKCTSVFYRKENCLGI